MCSSDLYGSDYPCWEPSEALRLLEAVKLSEADKKKLFVDNVRRVFGLPVVEPQRVAAE